MGWEGPEKGALISVISSAAPPLGRALEELPVAAQTDSCSESKSSWVVRRGETVNTQTQPHCPHYPEPLSSSGSSSRISRAHPPAEGTHPEEGKLGVSCLGGSGLGCFLLTSRTWSTISCMTSHWAWCHYRAEGRGSQGDTEERRVRDTRNVRQAHLRAPRRNSGALWNPGCGEGLPGQRPELVPTVLLRSRRLTQNLGGGPWVAAREQGCPPSPDPGQPKL